MWFETNKCPMVGNKTTSRVQAPSASGLPGSLYPIGTGIPNRKKTTKQLHASTRARRPGLDDPLRTSIGSRLPNRCNATHQSNHPPHIVPIRIRQAVTAHVARRA
jgi:hypothetical protein